MSESTPVQYTVDDSAAIGQWAARSRFGFDQTIERLKEAINARQLWLIHEIDPQMLLRRDGLAIRATRQLLFFHPRYMQRLLSADARAIVEVPLKIVAMTAADDAVVLRGPDIAGALNRYSGLGALGAELSDIVREVVGSVAD